MDFRSSVLISILTWYSRPETWRSVQVSSPYSSNSISPGVRDAGAVARRAVEARHNGELLSAACDAWGLSILEVARRAGISDVDVSRFAMTGEMESSARDCLQKSLLACSGVAK